MLRSTIKVMFYSGVALLLLFAILMMVVRLCTPVLNTHRALFEKWVSAYMHRQVHIGKLDAWWQGFHPDICLQNISVMDADNRSVALHINALKLDVNLLQSLWLRRLQPNSLSIEGVYFNVRYTPGQPLQLLAVSNATHSLDYRNVLDWLLMQHRLSLRRITLAVQDARQRHWDIIIPNIQLESVSKHHKVYGMAHISRGAQQPVDVYFNGALRGDVQHLDHMRMDGYVQVQHLALPDWFSSVRQGELSGKWWIHWEHQHVAKVQSTFHVEHVQWEDANSKKTLGVDSFSANAWWAPKTSGWLLAMDKVHMRIDHRAWVENALKLDFTPHEQHFQVAYVDVKDMCHVLLRSHILSNQWERMLQGMQPSGFLTNVHVVHQAPIAQRNHYSVAADMHQIAYYRWEKLPGVQGFSGSFYSAQDHGEAHIASQAVVLDFGGLFPRPLAMRYLSGNVRWNSRSDGGLWIFQADHVEAVNATIAAYGEFAVRVPVHTPQEMALSALAGVQLQDSSQAKWYLPVGILHQKVARWLDQAFTRGQGGFATFIFRGKVHQFPFGEGAGTFTVDADVKDSDLHYAEDWPDVQHIDARLIFHNEGMQCIASRGRILGAQLQQAEVSIPNLAHVKTVWLHLKGRMLTDMHDVVDYLRASPLHRVFGEKLSVMHMQGAAALQLQLDMPLENPEKTAVQGYVGMQSAQLHLPIKNSSLSVSALKGKLFFTESAIWSDHLSGLLFGKQIPFTVETRSNAQEEHFTRIQWESDLGVDALTKLWHISDAHYVTGKAHYHAYLDLYAAKSGGYHQSVFNITSDLLGVSSQLPEPYQKLSSVALPCAMSVYFGAYQPTMMMAKLGEARLKLSELPKVWRLDVDSNVLSGYILYPLDFPQTALVGRFTKFILQTQSSISTDLQSFNPAHVPPIDIGVENLQWNQQWYRDVVLQTKPIKEKGMALEKLAFTSPVLTAAMHGRWLHGLGQKDSSQLQGEVQTGDVRAFAKAYHMNSSIIGSSAKGNFDIYWLGSLLKPAASQLQGSVTFSLGPGRIIDLGTEATSQLNLGRLLTLLSLHRLLSMNFSDFTRKGYGFDKGEGVMHFNLGQILIRKLALDGSVADISAQGTTHLTTQALQLHVTVIPHVTSSLPIVAAVAVNPVVGAFTWVVDKVVGRAVNKITAHHYRIQGTWSKPVITPTTK